jgi:hypothetical protein
MKSNTFLLQAFIFCALTSTPAQAQRADVELWKSFGGSGPVTSVAYSPDGTILSVGSSSTIELWNIDTGKVIRIFKKNVKAEDADVDIPEICYRFSPDWRILASASMDTIILQDVATGKVIHTLRGPGNEIVFSPDGKMLASTGFDNMIKLWDVGAGIELRTLKGHRERVTHVAFSPDGKMLASGSEDWTVRLWDINTGREIHILTGHRELVTSIAFSPDGKILASSSRDGKMKLWDMGTQSELRTLTGPPFLVGSIAFSPDGKMLAIGCSDQTIILWDVGTVTKIREWGGHSSEVFSIAFSPDGKMLATGSFDTVKLWKMEGIEYIPPVPKPPERVRLSATLSFSERLGSNVLSAGATGKLIIALINKGNESARDLQINITSEALPHSIQITKPQIIETLPPGSTQTVEVPVIAGNDLLSGWIKLVVEVTEANGFNLDHPASIVFRTKAFEKPVFEATVVGMKDLQGGGNGEPNNIVEITARIDNRGEDSVRGVTAELYLEGNVLTQGSKNSFPLGDIAPGGNKEIVFSIVSNAHIPWLPRIILKDSHTHYTSLILLITPSSIMQKRTKIRHIDPNEPLHPSAKESSSFVNDIERDIPTAKARNSNAVALVIAISDYAHPGIPSVEYAKQDAALMRKYLVKTFGYDEKNILPTDTDEVMTRATMRAYANSITRSHLKKDGSSDLFVYYNGNGGGRTQIDEPFLVPYDCNPDSLSNNNVYNMSDFFADIASLNARSTTVVMDTWFSGLVGRGQQDYRRTIYNVLLEDENSVLFELPNIDPVTNCYPEKKHGMFTYFFLRGIRTAAEKSHDGTIRAVDLESYINGTDAIGGLMEYSRHHQSFNILVVSGNKQGVIIKLK